MILRFKRYLKGLIPVEVTLQLYLIVTSLVILFFWNGLEKPFIHLVIRVVIILLYFLIFRNRFNHEYNGLRIFIPFIFLPFLYAETDFFNNIFFFNLDLFVSNIECWLFGFQPSVAFSRVIPNRFFAELMYFGYFSYYFMVIGLVVYTYFFLRRDIGERVGFIIITSFLLFYLFFDFLPITGPQFYFIDYLKPLPEGYFFGPAIKFAQFIGERPTAAFPSSHVAICLILIRLSFQYTKRLFYILLFIGIILIFSTVYLRTHYVIDVIAGVISAPFVYFLVEQMFKKLSLPIQENF